MVSWTPTDGLLTSSRLLLLRDFLNREEEWAQEIAWAAQVGPPRDARAFAMEAAFVIIHGGLKAQVAGKIWERVHARLKQDLPVKGSGAFNHRGKVKAIDTIWSRREEYFEKYLAIKTDKARLEYLEGLPFVGPITRYHLAKNFGLHLAKPDRWLARIADLHGRTVKALCKELSEESGLPIPVVDTILWRCCNLGAISVGEERLVPEDSWLVDRWIGSPPDVRL